MSHRRFVRFLNGLLMLGILLAWPFAARAAPPTDQPSEITWMLDLAFESDAAAGAAAETLAKRLDDPRLSLRTAALGQGGGEPSGLALSGEGGLDQLRAILYTDLGWPGGPADLRLQVDSSPSEPFTLLLDANLTTGYNWDWNELDPALVALDGEPFYTSRAGGLGAPVTLSLPLRALTEGPIELHLRYRRAWLPAEPARATLTLQGARLPAVLDLSDPNPVLPVEPFSAAAVDPDPALTLDADLPRSFDWRDLVTLPPVRNQGGCGSCWAFTATGLLESSLAIFDGVQRNLSEQYLLNCNDQGWNCYGGGFSINDFHQSVYISPQLAAGAVLESALPYRGVQASCTAPYAHPHRITRWAYLPGSPPTLDQIKQAIYTYGPVASIVCVGPKFYAYQGGDFADDELCGQYGAISHAVLLVGWNEDRNVWIARNSWGPEWGMDGYMFIGYGVSRVGEHAHYVVPDSRPTAPLRRAPANGAIIPAGADVVLSWGQVRGGTPGQPIRYQLQVATEAGFTVPILDRPLIETTQSTVTLPPNRLLYWRVRAARAAPDGDVSGDWSTPAVLKTLPAAPQLLAPASSDIIAPASVDSIRPTLTWTVDGGAARFDLQIARDEAFTRLAHSAAPAASTYTPTVDLPRAALLYWRVRARAGYGVGPWSSPAAFITPTPPGLPALLAPASGIVLAPGKAVTLRWNPAAGSPGGYQVDVYPPADPTHPLLSESVPAGSTPALTVGDGLPPNQVLGWRVRSFKDIPAGRVYSGWSAARLLKILPERPILPAPEEITPPSGLRPRLYWTPPPGGSLRYDLQIHTGSACARLLRSAVVTGPAYTPTSDLPRLAVLSWRVRARAAYGAGLWSGCLPFTTPDPPAAPALRGPASGSTLLLSAPFRPRLIWAPAARQPERYLVQLDDNKAFTHPQERLVEAPAAELTWDADLATGSYFWRVRALRGELESSWSAVWSFKTPAALTGVVSDAYTGLPVSGAVVRVAGTSYASEPTAADGRYQLPVVPSGARTLTVTAPDFARLTRAVTIRSGGERVFNLPLARLPVKIVLNWSDHTQELDAQLWLPDDRPYHVHSHARGSLVSFPFAALTGGLTPRYGPETITLPKRVTGTYTYAVYRWDNGASARLPDSGATVQVYIGGVLKVTFTLPTSDSSNPWWHVFDLEAATGKILPGGGLVENSPGLYDRLPGSPAR